MTSEEIQPEFGWFLFKSIVFSIGGFMSIASGSSLYSYYFVEGVSKTQAGLTGSWLQIEQLTFALSFIGFSAVTLGAVYNVARNYLES